MWENKNADIPGIEEGQTLRFLPSMVVISASLPMVKELVTVFPGVLEVITKSLPLCLISVIGLMSLAILITSAGRSGKGEGMFLILRFHSRERNHDCQTVSPAWFNIRKHHWTSSGPKSKAVGVFLTHGLEELLVVLLGVNLPCSVEVHVG